MDASRPTRATRRISLAFPTFDAKNRRHASESLLSELLKLEMRSGTKSVTERGKSGGTDISVNRRYTDWITASITGRPLGWTTGRAGEPPTKTSDASGNTVAAFAVGDAVASEEPISCSRRYRQ